MKKLIFFGFVLLAILLNTCVPETEKSSEDQESTYLQISGIYPHLTAHNLPDDTSLISSHRECGIGAVAPWAGKLWYLTYPPHMRLGSNDKLYMVDEEMNLTIRPESVGGTHANRMIHKESEQLIIGPYFIDKEGQVRTADLQQLEGRLTATTRHLTDPENKVLFYEMEGQVYEVNVHTLEVNKLFDKPVPGWHGKGAYVGQGRFVLANNGEHQGHPMGYSKLLVGGEATNEEEAGVLAEWDGTSWRIIERKQFTDVSGPGGLYGNASEEDPIWSMGWDKRSVILKLLDGGEWYTYRLPKASHTYDPRHGWFTEWPRIREIGPNQMMMVMHGTMYYFPKTFTRANSAGIRPMATHLRYIPDFGTWNGRIFLAADDASTLQNPIVGQAQSNLWFGTEGELTHFGPRSGWGGVWLNDLVEAGVPSDPFLLKGYDQRVLHLTHTAKERVEFLIEIDASGKGDWKPFKNSTVDASGYAYEVLPEDLAGTWCRISSSRSAHVSAYFHYYSLRNINETETAHFQGLADIGAPDPFTAALIRPAGHNRSLQVYLPGEKRYLEVELNEPATDLVFDGDVEDRSMEVLDKAVLSKTPYQVDDASVILENYDGQRYRLPKGALEYEELWPLGAPRALREVQSERYLANFHGMFYEVPRAEGAGNHIPDFQKIKPVSRHDRKISDFCTWRGLLVLAGVRQGAAEDGQVFSGPNGEALWFGNVDDLWKFGKPVGEGGPWKNTLVKAGQPSDPYLMTGFDQKRLELAHRASGPVQVQVEVAIDHEEWVTYQRFEVPEGETVIHSFPQGFHAHWVRLRTDRDCEATGWLVYE